MFAELGFLAGDFQQMLCSCDQVLQGRRIGERIPGGSALRPGYHQPAFEQKAQVLTNGGLRKPHVFNEIPDSMLS